MCRKRPQGKTASAHRHGPDALRRIKVDPVIPTRSGLAARFHSIPNRLMAAGLLAIAGALAVWAWPVERPRPGAIETAGRCPGEVFAIERTAGGAAPYLRRTVLGREGAMLIDYGATASTLSAALSGKSPGVIIDAPDFRIPGFAGGRFRVVTYGHLRAPAGGQLGVIGTDFLSLMTGDFVYAGSTPNALLSPRPCPPETLAARGLVRIDQSGFFSSRPGELAPGRPNVPVLFLSVAGIHATVATWAQIDTGYDDLEAAPSIDINAPLLKALQDAGVPLKAAAPISVSTCDGLERRQVFKLAALSLTQRDRTPIRQMHDVTLVLKRPNGCGGIAGLAEPAAQLAASVLPALSEIVFDPFRASVWVRPSGPHGAAQHSGPADGRTKPQ